MKYKSVGNKKRGIRMLSCVTAIFMIFAATGSSVYAAGSMTKEETVYVITDAAGNRTETIVSDHLYNSDSLKTITDVSGLKDIENVKGDEKFKKGSGDQIIWQADGEDIYYQGKTEEQVPITLDVSYYLDGKQVSGSELDGKSGNVKINIKYENNCTVTVDGKSVKVPFVAMTGFLVEDDCFKNVSVSSGKVIDDGEKQVVVGMAVPGLSETLGVSSDKTGFSDEVEITGTAEGFSLEDMMTVITSNIFEDVDTDQLASLDMDGQINELDSAATKLAQGASTLYDGVHMLSEKSSALTDGVSKLNAGAQQLNAGAAQALEGSKTLAAGNAQLSAALNENLGTMQTNIAQLSAGGKQVLDGFNAIHGKVAGDGTAQNPGLAAAAGSVANGAASIQGIVSAKTQTSIASLNDAVTLLDTLKANETDADTIAKYDEAEAKIAASIAAQNDINNATQTLSATAGAVSQGSQQLSDSLTELGNGVGALCNGMQQLNAGLADAGDKIDLITGSAAKLAAGASDLEKGQTALSSGAQELATGMTQLGDSSLQLIGGIKQLDKGSMELSKGMQQFYDQGIKKIVDLYNSDLKGITGNVDSVIKAGQQYKTFTSLPDAMDGSVKFIYKTEIM